MAYRQPNRPLGNAQTGYAKAHGGQQQTDPENNIPLSEDAFTPTAIWNNMFRNSSTGNNELSVGARTTAAPDVQSDADVEQGGISNPSAGWGLSTMAAGGPTHIQMWGGGMGAGGGPMRFPNMANDPSLGKAGALTGGNIGGYASNVLSFNKSLYAPADTQQSSLPVTPSTATETWNNTGRSGAADIASRYGPDSTAAIAGAPKLPASNFMWGSNNTA